MAVFEVQGPDGKTYEVDAPDEGAALDAFRSFTAGQPQQPAPNQAEQAVPWYTPITSVPKDIGEIATGIYNTVRHPIQTTEGIGKMLEGGLQYMPQIPGVKALNDAVGGPQPTPEQLQSMQDSKALVGNAAGQIADNFSSPTKAWNTVAENPVDTLMMLAPSLNMAGKASQAANMPRLANGLTKFGNAIDPATIVNKAAQGTVNMGGGLLQSVPNGQTRLSAAILRKVMPDDLSSMDKLGPEGMLLDASPSMTGLARGVAAKVGPGTDKMVEALIARDKGKSARMKAGSDAIFGPGRDPNAMNAELMKKAKVESRSFYDQAKNNTPEFRDPQLENTLAYQLTDPAKGMTQNARNANLGWMDQIDDALKADTPQDAASRLHGLRQELDQITNPGPMATPDQKNLAAAAQNARNAVDDILKNRIPGMAEGDAAYAARMKQKDAFNYGFDSLEGGKSAVWPETFNKDLSKMDKGYVAQGQASRIGNAMGTQSNDLIAIRRMLGGEGDFNRAKLEATFGPRKVDDALGLVDAENTMAQNFADIARNSKTAQSLEAAKLIETNKPFNADGGLTTMGLGGKIMAGTGNYLMKKVAGRVSGNTADALAKALMADKPTAQSLLSALNKPGVSLKDKTLVRAILFSGAAQGAQSTP